MYDSQTTDVSNLRIFCVGVCVCVCVREREREREREVCVCMCCPHGKEDSRS